MTLTPNRQKAFFKTFSWMVFLILFFMGIVPLLRGQTVHYYDVLEPAIIGGGFLALFVAIMFTPKEIYWDDEIIKIKAIFPGSGEYARSQLEAYSPFVMGVGTFLIKFEGKQAFQIVPVGFRSSEWNAFLESLRSRFPEKKTWLWLGPTPIRFGRK